MAFAPSREPLAPLPTPLQELPRLAVALGGPRLLIKRDDLTGFALGGNKVRKLEFFLADARANGADVLITCGGVQSNHCRVTAAAAALAGMRCVLVLSGRRPERLTGNVLLDHLFGAELIFVELTEVLDDYVGEGYGIPTPVSEEAARLFAQHEGVVLDPTYSAKAAAGLIDLIRRGRFGRAETVCFWHTGGNLALL